MANGFVVNAHRFDPYKNFKFQIEWDNKPVAGVSKVERAEADHRGGQASQRRREQSSTISRPDEPATKRSCWSAGLTHDPEFEAWANRVHHLRGRQRDGPRRLQEGTDAGRHEREADNRPSVISSTPAGSASSRPLPDLDANANAVAIESLKIELEGWERDLATTEPDESE